MEPLENLVKLVNQEYFENRPLILGVDWVIPEFLLKDLDRDDGKGIRDE